MKKFLLLAGLILGLAVASWCAWSKYLKAKVFCPVEGEKCRYEKLELGQKTAYVFQLRPGDRVVAVMDGQLVSGGVTYSQRFGRKVCRQLINRDLDQTLDYCLPLDPEKTSFIKPKNVAKGALLWQADQNGELVIWGDLETIWRR